MVSHDAQYSYEERSPKEIIVEQRRGLFNKTEVEVERRKHYEEAVSQYIMSARHCSLLLYHH